MDFLVLFGGYCALTTLVIGCFMFDCPLHRHPYSARCLSAIYRIFRGIWGVIPKSVRDIADIVYHYIFFQRNAVFQILYVAMVLGGHVIIFVDTLPYLYAKDPDTNHTLWLSVLFFINAILFLVSCYSDPGVVTRLNVMRYGQAYAYDDVMYKPGKKCSTCGLEKIPRSKHCAVYNKCVHRFDHYCAWTNNCVGGLNHRYFLLFLVSICAMVLNGLVLNTHALVNIVTYFDLWKMRYVDQYGVPQPMDFPALIQALFMQYPRIVFLVAALSAIFVVMVTFTLYHVFLILTSQTTNERYKKHYLKEKDIQLPDYGYSRGLISNILEIALPFRFMDSIQIAETQRSIKKSQHKTRISRSIEKNGMQRSSNGKITTRRKPCKY